MTFLLGSAKSQASQQAAVSGLQLQSSAYGKALPVVYGTTRIPPNLIWYGDFIATAQQAASAGGKGAGGGGGGKGGSGTSYTYQTAVALGLCEGPVLGVGLVYANKSTTTLGALGLGFFSGEYGQASWGHLSTSHPGEAIGYSGVCYVAAVSYNLGDNPHLPNHNFEVYGKYAFGVDAALPDADPSDVIYDLLMDPNYGVGFPAERIASLATYQSYALANGLWFSLSVNQQEQASSLLDTLSLATNSAFVWSSGMLSLVPYGDENVSANGYSYTAPSVPLFDLTYDDFVLSSNDADPVQVLRKRPSDRLNVMRIECLDRNNSYNPAIVEAKDQALIDEAGLRASGSAQRHMFADVNAARRSVQLELQRQAVRNVYRFSLDARYVLLDPMDIVTLTDEKLGLNRQWVRISEINENEDGTLNIVAEEYLQGTGAAPLYGQQAGQGFVADANADPGAVNPPVIFEPTAELANASEIWLGISGGTLWGGCEVWISNDAESYRYAGRITGAARTGRTTAALPVVQQSSSGQTVDAVNVLRVDLSESEGELLSASQADASALATLCYVNGEFIAYRDAHLTAKNNYDLGWLVRGAYGSTVNAHGAHEAFARVDSSLLKIPFTADAIGSTVYYKCVSFNIYGAGTQTLAGVNAFAYTIKGTAYASPPANIVDLTTSYIAGITQLTWTEIKDFRPVLYEIRKGTNWGNAQILAQVAHPPFTAQGNGTYWVAALCQPWAGIRAYSTDPQDIIITGAQITSNVMASWDEAATSWSGSVGGSAVVMGGQVKTSGAGNILAEPAYLSVPDLFNYGFIGDGTYEIPAAHRIDIGRVAPCSVLISWTSFAQNIHDNVLAVDDMLGYQDVLGYAIAGNANVYPEISLSQDGTTWGAWQKFTPGMYSARAFKGRMQLRSYDNNTTAILQGFTFAVDVPDRDDHYVNIALSTSGTAIAFTPDGAASPAPFNGGPQGSPSTPLVQVSILNAQTGDVAVISSVTLSGCTVQVLNAGVGVVRNVNVLVQGY